MKRINFFVFLMVGLAAVGLSLLLTAPVLAEQSRAVVINEVNPAGGWVELMNTTDDSIDLSSWYLDEYTNPNDNDTRTNVRTQLSGSIPPLGLIIFQINNLDASGDRVSLFHGDPILSEHYLTENDDSYVTYGTANPDDQENLFSSVDIEAPTGDLSIINNLNSYAIAPATKGWFNQETDSIPTWAELISNICAPEGDCPSGVRSNITSVENRTAVNGLYFSKTGLGKIEFSGTVNLTDTETLETINSLNNRLAIGQGLLSFSPVSGSSLADRSAQLTMLGLPAGREYVLSDIIVKNDAGEVIDPSDTDNYPVLADFSFNSTDNTLSFSTSHFTSFEVSTSSLDIVPPQIEIIDPISESQQTGDITITASSSDDGSGIESVRFFYRSGENISVLISEQDAPAEGNYYRALWDTRNVDNGTYHIFAVARDSQNNSSTSTEIAIAVDNVSLDRTPPSGSFLQPSAGYLATTTTLFEVSATETDSSIQKVEFYIDDLVLLGTSINDDGGGVYSFSWTPENTGLATGEHFIFAKIYNTDNYATTTSSQLINIDISQPIVSISYSPSGPTNGNVTATINSNRPIFVDGTIEANTNFPYTFIDNGTHTFAYSDQVGHKGSALATVTNIDRLAPVIVGLIPTTYSRVSNETILSFSSSEYVSPMCQVDGTNWSGCNDTTFAAIAGWPNISDGPFTLSIRDQDHAGNIGATSTTFIKDTQAPSFVSAEIISFDTIIVRFNEDLETASTSRHYLSVDDFEVSENGQVKEISQISETDGVVTLTLATLFSNSNPQIQLIINPVQPMSIADVAGNVYTAKTTEIPADRFAPLISSAVTASARTIILSLTEDLQTTIESGDFTFYSIRDGSTISLPVSGVSYSTKQILITVGADMIYGDTIRYNIKANSSLSDLAENKFNNNQAFSGNVTNNLSLARSSSGGGGSRAATTNSTFGFNSSTTPAIEGLVLGASTFRFLKDLSWCMQNSDVMELQLRLTKEGYLKVPATGYFGPNTLAAVKNYQLAHNLPNTGFFGPLTRGVMNGPSIQDRTAQINQIRQQILNLQALLNNLSSGNR